MSTSLDIKWLSILIKVFNKEIDRRKSITFNLQNTNYFKSTWFYKMILERNRHYAMLIKIKINIIFNFDWAISLLIDLHFSLFKGFYFYFVKEESY